MATFSQRILKNRIDIKNRELKNARKNAGNNPQRKANVKKLEKQLATLVSKRTELVPKTKQKDSKGRSVAKANAAASYGGQGGLSSKDARSIAIATQRENVAAKRKTAKDPLAVNIQGTGSKPTSTVREQQKAEARKKATADNRKRYLAKQKEAARLKKIKKPTKAQIRDLELVPKSKREKVRRSLLRPRSLSRIALEAMTPPPPQDPLAVNIQGTGSKPTSTVREQQKAEARKKATADNRKRYLAKQKEAARLKKIKKPTKAQIRDLELVPGSGKTRKRRRPKPLETQDSRVPVSRRIKEREFLGFGGGIDPAAGVPFKIPTKGKRKPIAQLMDAPGGGPKIKKRKPIAQLMDAPGSDKTRAARKVKKVVKKRKPSDFERYGLTDQPIKRAKDIRIVPTKKKVVKKRKPSDFERYGLTDQPIKRAKDIRIVPTKKKVKEASVDTTADFTDEYEQEGDWDKYVTSGSGDFVTDSSGNPITLGDFRISADSDDYDVGHKHGGKVGKAKKKAKSRKRTTKGRKRAALRGHRAELRGG